MKKFFLIFIFIFLLLFLLICAFFIKRKFDNNNIIVNNRNEVELLNLEKVTDNIYIDKSSIEKTQYTISAWFKMYIDDDTPEYNINDIPVYYELIKYEADCNESALCLKHIKLYDKNNNILSDEINNNGICSNSNDGWINGEIVYKTICKYKKAKE